MSSKANNQPGALDQLLAETGIDPAWLTITYTRSNPASEIIGFELDNNELKTRGYLKHYREAGRAAEVLNKQTSLRTRTTKLGPDVRLLSDGCTLLYLFPHDGVIRHLAHSTDLDKLKRDLRSSGAFNGMRVRGSKSTIQVFRYKPEHRALARITLAMKDDETGDRRTIEGFLRVFSDDRGTRIARLCESLRTQGLSDLVPEQLAVLKDGRLHLEALRPGRPLFEAGMVPPPETVAEALCRLGSAQTRIPVVSPTQHIRNTLAPVIHGEHNMAGEVSALCLQRAGYFDADYLGVMHGDMHPGQWLVDGEQLSLIDYERAANAHPAFDVGHFAAEIRLLELREPEHAEARAGWRRQFTEAWLERRPEIPREAVEVATALGLIAAAGRSLRKALTPDNPENPDILLETAAKLLRSLQRREASENWSAIFPGNRSPWAARAGEDGSIHGVFDPEAGTFEPLEPSDDVLLSGLAPALREGRLVSWRVGRRAVVRLNNGNFRKIVPPHKTRKLAQRISTLQASFGDGVPALVSVDIASGWLDLAPTAGDSLTARLKVGDTSALAPCANVVARLHAISSTDEVKPENLERWRNWTSELFPDEAEEIEATFRAMPAPARGRSVLIHGDLHDKNILIEAERAALIDCEGVSSGHPARDVGNLLAHFRLRSLQWQRSSEEMESWQKIFLAHYTEIDPSLHQEDIRTEELRALFRLSCVYRFRKKWATLASDLRKIVRNGLPLILVWFLVGCVAIIDEPVSPTMDASGEEARARLGVSYLKNEETVEVEGRFDGQRFMASLIEIEEPDDEIEVKSDLRQVDPVASSLQVGNWICAVTDDSVIEDPQGKRLSLEALVARRGEFCKVEARQTDSGLILRKLALRIRGETEADELQGQIEALSRSRQRFELAGTEVRFRDTTPVFWDVADTPPPSPQDRGLRPRAQPRLKRILRIDDDDLRQGTGIRLAEGIILGGEVQWDLEWRRNHNLRKGRPRDRLIQEPSLKLEVSFDISPQFFAFAKLNMRRDWAIFDERDDDQHGSRISINEAYFVALDFPFPGLALEVGRQKFDHGREWVMDDEIDAIRLFANLEPGLIEFSISQELYDESPEEDGVTNLLAAAHFEPFDDAELFIYGLYRCGGRRIDLDRYHAGFTFESSWGGFSLYADFGYVVGSEDDLDVEGFGFDVLFLYVFDESDWEPSIYLGIAWGSGDDDTSDGKDSSFRQTGLNDNNDEINGVTSFRYLGELVRPEVSNLMVLTAGFGFHPYKRTSIDVLFHHYRQVVASTVLRDTRIRLDPMGMDPTIGTEIDLIIGIEYWRPWEFEIVLAYFRPGEAFGQFQDEAWFMTFQAEFNF